MHKVKATLKAANSTEEANWRTKSLVESVTATDASKESPMQNDDTIGPVFIILNYT